MNIDHNSTLDHSFNDSIPMFKRCLQEAKLKASKAIEGMDDIGTCNFDSLFIPVGENHMLHRKLRRFECSLTELGFSYYYHSTKRQRGYIISPGVGGQGVTRTKAVEVMRAFLKSKGYDVRMWYQVD